jgi:O-antigen biosynthesis protein
MANVSIIIAFRDRVDLLRDCVRSVLESIADTDVEIILVDNRSEATSVKAAGELLSEDGRIRMHAYDKPFNYSAINNHAAREAVGEYLLFLNNDTRVVCKDWLKRMLELADRTDVGAVGARLLYPDDTIQHAGVILGPNLAVHAFSGFSQDDPLFVEYGSKVREWGAVTAACMMTRRDVFLELGGFDETNFPVAYNDVDYCLRLRKGKGLKTMMAPDAILYHFESASRGSDVLAKFTNPLRYRQFRREQRALRDKWGREIDSDPYYDGRFLRRK